MNSLIRLKCPNYSCFLSTNWQLQSPESLAGFSCMVRFNERYKHHKKINFNTENCNQSRRLLLIISSYLSNKAKWYFWQCSITEQGETAILPVRTGWLGRLPASCFLRYTYVWPFVANKSRCVCVSFRVEWENWLYLFSTKTLAFKIIDEIKLVGIHLSYSY